MGEFDRFKFYDHMKVYLAAPPDVLRVDEKNLREHNVFNVCGVVMTTNHKTDGIYLPADDRRHFVAWSDARKSDFTEAYWNGMWGWYEREGFGHVAAYLAALDLRASTPRRRRPRRRPSGRSSTQPRAGRRRARRRPRRTRQPDAVNHRCRSRRTPDAELAPMAHGTARTAAQSPTASKSAAMSQCATSRQRWLVETQRQTTGHLRQEPRCQSSPASRP